MFERGRERESERERERERERKITTHKGEVNQLYIYISHFYAGAAVRKKLHTKTIIPLNNEYLAFDITMHYEGTLDRNKLGKCPIADRN